MRSFSSLIAVFLVCSFAFAGGPLATKNGVAVRYQNATTITYKTDRGKFGNYTSAQARALVDSSFAAWQNVASCTVAFQHAAGDTLPVDVTSANWSTYTTQTDIKYDGINPIIFDDNGAITDALFGSGASNSVIGFAGSGDQDDNGFYDEGESVMNGKFAGTGTTTFTLAEWKSTFVHEFGHFLGLDHTQINGKFVDDSAKTIYIPTMYPTSTANDTPLGDLNPDDIAAISAIYPEPTFPTSTGKISGTVTRVGNIAVRGANVIAISAGADSLMNEISTITDYYLTVSGTYTVVGLQPGSYVVRVEPIDPSFTEGSSVGPYAFDNTDISFLNPVKPEFYNGANESDDPTIDTANARIAVSVSAGQTTSNINIIANRAANAPVSNLLEYNSAVVTNFELPSEFDDQLYAVRFTPGINSKFVKVEFFIPTGANTLKGTGSLRVKLHQNTSGSVGGVPGSVMGTPITVPFSGLTKGIYNAVDFSAQNIPLTANVDFHVSFEVIGGVGDTVRFGSDDDDATESDRTSSFYDAGDGIQWYNFIDPNNWGYGYNLAVRSYISFPVSGVEGETIVPLRPGLDQNYPNPFNPSTTIRYRVKEAGIVSLKVFNVLGQEVADVVHEFQSAGEHVTLFSGKSLPSGVYFSVLTAGTTREIKRMTLLK